MNQKTNGTVSGIGVTGLLQVAFIVLKLCKVISWSWLWVLAPAWISVLIFIIAVLALIVLCSSK